MRNSLAPAHWSKDFVEHLRTVHFALIAISVGLILLVISSKEYNAALVQVQEILDLKKEWSLDWIKAHGQHLPDLIIQEEEKTNQIVTSILSRGPSPIHPRKILPTSSGYNPVPKDNFRVISHGPDGIRPVVFDCHVTNENWFQARWNAANWSPTDFPRTLSEFESWWAELNHTPPIYFPRTTDVRWFLEDDFAFEKETDTEEMLNVDLKFIRVQPNGLDWETTRSPGFYRGNFERNKKFHVVGIFVDSYVAYRVTENAVIETFTNLRPGPFHTTFEDLFVAAHDEADLPLETIRDFLHDKAAKGPEVFEAFGMKFPAGQITFGGTSLLLCVQLYFLVYLRQLFGQLEQNDSGWDVPWIAMDSSKLSKTILYVSTVILPCIAAILPAWQAIVRLSSGYWEKNGHYAILLKIIGLIFAAIASGYLGFLSWKYRPQVTPEARSCSPQLFE